MKTAKPVLCLVLFCFLILAGRTVSAQIVPMSVEELYAASDSVVHGKVVEQRTSSWKNKIYTISTISVGEEFRKEGTPSAFMDIITIGGSIGPISSMAVNQAEIHSGEEVILFLSKPTNEKQKSDLPDIEFDSESPFHNNFVVIGGPQGKFEAITPKDDEADKDAKVVKTIERVSFGRSLRSKKSDPKPTVDSFISSLRELKTRSKDKSNLRTKSIPTVGEIKTLERQADLGDLRVFDPVHLQAADAKKAAQQKDPKDSN